MDDKDIEVKEVAEILIEHSKPIAKITGGCIIAAILYLLIATPFYESVATLQIKQQSKGGGALAALTGLGGADFLGMGSVQMGTYEEILKSRGVIIPVIEATEEKTGLFKKSYPRYESYVKEKIVTEILKKTDILQVKVTGKTAEGAQQANKLLIDNFLKRIAELNSAEKGTMKKFLNERVKTAQDELNKAETALEKFRAENKIISPTTNAEIFANRIMEVEKRAAVNQVEMEAAQAKLAAINSQLNGSGAASADNVTIQKFNAELAKLEAERISYVDKYTEKHPKMIEVNDRIVKLKSKVQEEINKVAALQAPSDNEVHQALVAGKYQSEGEVVVTRQKATAFQQVIDQNNAELEKLPAVEREYVKLERDFKVANEVYLMLTKKLEETKITEYQQPDNVLLIDEPTLPDKPSKPRKGLTLILSMLLGIMGSSGYIVFKEMMNKTIRSEDDLKKYLELPILGCIPEADVVIKTTVDKQKQKGFEWLDKLKEYIWKL